MVVPKIAICPICGKKTYMRIEDGGYLKEYPIRFNCMNCRALIKGTYKYFHARTKRSSTF